MLKDNRCVIKKIKTNIYMHDIITTRSIFKYYLHSIIQLRHIGIANEKNKTKKKRKKRGKEKATTLQQTNIFPVFLSQITLRI